MNRLIFSALIILGTNVNLDAQVARSERSEEVYQRIAPILQRQLIDKNLNLGRSIFLRLFKQENELEVWVEKDDRYVLFKIFEICFYSGELGPKTIRGDGQSPEGFYFVNSDRMNPWSRFHLSINIGYPNAYDRFKGYTGDYLMIHGDCVSIGCYAMTDRGIEEIYTLAESALNNGVSFFRVHIFPFRMTDENMEKFKLNPWFLFWENLKEGYDFFEESGVPPNVEVADGRYVFN